MKHVSLLLSALCLVISCSNLPKVHPVPGLPVPEIQKNCRNLFPEGKWQFLHAIEVVMPRGETGLFMGVTVISSHDQTVRCAIMTIEGLVVFEAQYDQQLVIKRGVPPFDSEDFAEGLMKDIRLLFFMPEGPLIESGVLKNGSFVCRHRNPDEQIVDIINYGDNRWELRQYNPELRLIRTVKSTLTHDANKTGKVRIPNRIELTAHGSPEYTLVMNLVEAVPLND